MLSVRRQVNERCDRDSPSRNGGTLKDLSDRPVERERVGKHELAAAPNAPAILHHSGGDLLSHCRAAENDRLANRQRGVSRTLGVDGTRNARAVEQDTFLRQPHELRALVCN